MTEDTCFVTSRSSHICTACSGWTNHNPADEGRSKSSSLLAIIGRHWIRSSRKWTKSALPLFFPQWIKQYTFVCAFPWERAIAKFWYSVFLLWYSSIHIVSVCMLHYSVVSLCFVGLKHCMYGGWARRRMISTYLGFIIVCMFGISFLDVVEIVILRACAPRLLAFPSCTEDSAFRRSASRSRRCSCLAAELFDVSVQDRRVVWNDSCFLDFRESRSPPLLEIS